MDIYPNDGQTFDDFNTAPKELDAEEREQQTKFEKSYPIVEDLIKHFEEIIKESDSLTGLGVDSSMPAVQVQILIEANKKFQALINTELEKLKNLDDTFKGK